MGKDITNLFISNFMVLEFFKNNIQYNITLKIELINCQCIMNFYSIK